MQAEDSRKCLSHKRSIIFLQTDLISKLPEFSGKPAIVQWEGNVVARNEVARSYGITEHLSVSTAYEICPDVTVLGPEHVARLAAAVIQIDSVVRNLKFVIERVSLDECYLEITDNSLVEKLNTSGIQRRDICQCGSADRLHCASQIAVDLQMAIESNLRVKSRVGVSYSKMLARLAALTTSPGHFSIITPSDAKDALRRENLRYVLPGFLASALERQGILTTQDLRDTSLVELETALGSHFAMFAVDAACGTDMHPVLPRDSWRLLSIQMEISEKFSSLLFRLLSQVEDEGRIPQVVKVSVRKFDPVRKTTSKEFKTAPIPSVALPSCRRPSAEAANKLMNLITSLFYRLVDFSKPVHLSLLGLAFVRFHEESPRMRLPPFCSQISSAPSVATRLLRKRDVSVETPLCIYYEGDSELVNRSLPKSIFSESADVEDLPAPREKRAKLDVYIKNLQDEQMDLCSPSKLKVGDLSLGDEMKKKPRSLLQC